MRSMEIDLIKYEDEIYFFIQISQSFFHVYQEHLEYIDKENCLLTVLFGAFGDVIVDEFYNIDKLKLKKIFDFIEQKLDSNDKYFEIIIATGLVESIVINAEKIDNTYMLLHKILFYCGNKTMEYIKTWSEYQGINI